MDDVVVGGAGSAGRSVPAVLTVRQVTPPVLPALPSRVAYRGALLNSLQSGIIITHPRHNTERSGLAPGRVGPPGLGHGERLVGPVVSEVEGRLGEVSPAQVR